MKRLFLAVRQKRIIITILSATFTSELFKLNRIKNPSVKENLKQLDLSQTIDMSFKLISTSKYCANTIWHYFKVKKKYKFYGLEIPLISTNPIEV